MHSLCPRLLIYPEKAVTSTPSYTMFQSGFTSGASAASSSRASSPSSEISSSSGILGSNDPSPIFFDSDIVHPMSKTISPGYSNNPTWSFPPATTSRAPPRSAQEDKSKLSPNAAVGRRMDNTSPGSSSSDELASAFSRLLSNPSNVLNHPSKQRLSGLPPLNMVCHGTLEATRAREEEGNLLSPSYAFGNRPTGFSQSRQHETLV